MRTIDGDKLLDYANELGNTMNHVNPCDVLHLIGLRIDLGDFDIPERDMTAEEVSDEILRNWGDGFATLNISRKPGSNEWRKVCLVLSYGLDENKQGVGDSFREAFENADKQVEGKK